MFKKSQAAIEFLSTWGWALLMILLILIALSYFGLFSAWEYLPGRCDVQVGLQCYDFKATSSGVTIVLKNKFGYKITDVNIKLQDCGESTGPSEIDNGQLGEYNINCAIATKSFKGNFNVTYILSETGLMHTSKGEVIVRVQ